MAAPFHFGTPFARLVASWEAPPKTLPAAGFAWRPRPMSAHRSHVSGSSTAGPSGKVRIAAPPHFGTPCARFVAT
eukprot:5979263-Pyramimonas_sp.AAC.1